MHHNNIREITASLVSDVCTNVTVEPELQRLTSEKLHDASVNRDNGTRVDVAADGFWGSAKEWTFLDIAFLTRILLQTGRPHCHRHTEGM